MNRDNGQLRVQAERLIADFAKTVGIDDMAFDEEDQCNLAFDDQPLAIGFDEETGYLSLGGPLMEIPSSPSAGFYAWGLESNFATFTSGLGCLALDTESGSIVWLDRRPLEGMVQATFEDWLSSGLDRMEFLKRQLPEMSNSAALAAPSQEADLSVSNDVVFRL